MPGDDRSISVKCSSCGSKNLICIDLQEISYDHLMEATYRCTVCGHTGKIVLDCMNQVELKLSVE